jgi:hypothetical protein
VVQLLRELGTPLLDGTGPMPYSAVQSIFDPLFPAEQLQYYWKSLYISELTDEAIQTMITWSRKWPSPMSIVDLWAMGLASVDFLW